MYGPSALAVSVALSVIAQCDVSEHSALNPQGEASDYSPLGYSSQLQSETRSAAGAAVKQGRDFLDSGQVVYYMAFPLSALTSPRP